MPQFIANSSQEANPPALPLVRLLLRGPEGLERRFEFRQNSLLIGTVLGCDIQLAAESLPELLAIATVVPGGLKFRRLHADAPFALNGQSVELVTLKVRDEWSCGEYHLRLDFLADTTLSTARATPPSAFMAPSPDVAELKEQLEKDRLEWEVEAEQQAEALAVQVRQVQEKEKQLQAERTELEKQKAKLSGSGASDLEAVRSELLKLRDSLYQQYRQRRDAVVAMREAVRRAAYKVQEQKRALQQGQSRHESALDHYRHEQTAFSERQNEMAKQAKLLEEWQRELNNDQKDLAGKNEALAQSRHDLEAKTRELHADLVRQQRLQETLESKQKDADQREALLLEREHFIGEERSKLMAERSRLEQQERNLQVRQDWQVEKGKDLAKHAVELLQQKELVQKEAQAVQERIQRLAQWEQQLGADRLRLDRLEAEMRQRADQLKLEQQRWREEEATWHARQQALQQEVIRLQAETDKHQQLQAGCEAKEQELASKQLEIEQKQAETEERATLLQQRTQRLLKLRHRLRQQRQFLAERLQHATDAESAHEALQEQLRHRTVALSQRESQLNEQEAGYQLRLSQLQDQTQELAENRQVWEATLGQERDSLEARRVVLDQQAIQLDKDRGMLTGQQETLVAERKDFNKQLQQTDQQRQAIEEQGVNLAQARTKLLESLPSLLRTAETTLERLNTARNQLRVQLQEIHAYRKRCQEEIEARRQETVAIIKLLDERSQVLSHLQDEQRLEAAALRQDCLSWQAQIESLEVKWRATHRELADEAERIASRAQELDVNHGRLEIQAEELEGQAHDVAYRRSEVNRHLAEMQDWYKHKLRDLAEKKLPQQTTSADEELYDSPHILPLKSTRTNTDQHLADLLSGMGLIDALTLQALLDEARQQRITLRDCLLQNEFLTPYQMELIEAGRLEALVLNSLRVIDRLRIGSMETIYRVFDPRLGDEALLRHLSLSVDPMWQEEYRTLFQQAALIRHPNVALTLEVLNMSGSPAVVQEWLIGLPGTEWNNLITESSVACKLIRQAAAGLSAIHEAGLVHGQLQLERLLLTGEGELKICGAGEPKWLQGLAAAEERTIDDDVADLIALVLPWCRGKSRQENNVALADFTKQLETKHFNTAQSLEKAADIVLRSSPTEEEAWQRLLQFIQDRLNFPESSAPQKKSA